MTTPVGIGNGSGRRLSFRERARVALETALADRDIAPVITHERPSNGPGIVAVVVDGKKRLMALGEDEAAAEFALARLASTPVGRS